jgi:hypothetical protein
MSLRLRIFIEKVPSCWKGALRKGGKGPFFEDLSLAFFTRPRLSRFGFGTTPFKLFSNKFSRADIQPQCHALEVPDD